MTPSSHRPWCTALAGALVFLLVQSMAGQQLPFEQVVAQLKSPDAGARLSALRLLRESGYPEAASPIAPLLSDPEPRIRREALQTELELFLPSDAARSRISLVGSRRGSVSAARAFESNWGAMPAGRVPVEIVTGLLTSLKDPSAETRVEAAYAIGLLGQIDGVAPDLGYKTVVEALADRMGDASASVRVAVARASGRVFRRCPSGCGAIAVERLGDALIRLVNDPEPAVQVAAMEGLGEMRYERAVKGLAEVFEFYKRGEMGYAALDTLARIGSAASAPLFRTALASKDANFRRAAVEGLARSGDKSAGEALRPLEGAERDASVALAFAYARHKGGGQSEAPRLVQALADRTLREQARDYLIELGPAVAPDLAAALPAAAPEARVALLEALGVNGRSAQVPAIESLEHDRDARVAAAASRTLVRIRALGPTA